MNQHDLYYEVTRFVEAIGYDTSLVVEVHIGDNEVTVTRTSGEMGKREEIVTHHFFVQPADKDAA